jgi:hypothetical protein
MGVKAISTKLSRHNLYNYAYCNTHPHPAQAFSQIIVKIKYKIIILIVVGKVIVLKKILKQACRQNT